MLRCGPSVALECSAVDDGGDLQRQQAAAAAEDAFALHAVAVVDAVADLGDVAVETIDGGQRLTVEARADPVDLEERKRLGFGELAGVDRRRVARATAGGREREEGRDQRERGPCCSGAPPVVGGGGHGRHYLGVPARSTSASAPPNATSEPRVLRSAGVSQRTTVDLRTARRWAAPAARPPIGLLALLAALIALWLAVDPRTPDLAAQVYRVALFHQLGWAVWDDALVRRTQPARLQPAVPAAGIAAGHPRRWVPCACSPRRFCSSGSSARPTARQRHAGVLRGSRWRPSATCGSGG